MAKALVWDSRSSVSVGIEPHWWGWGQWYVGTETEIPLYSPFASYLTNKKWWLEEEMANHLLRGQQVTFDHLNESLSFIQGWVTDHWI